MARTVRRLFGLSTLTESNRWRFVPDREPVERSDGFARFMSDHKLYEGFQRGCDLFVNPTASSKGRDTADINSAFKRALILQLQSSTYDNGSRTSLCKLWRRYSHRMAYGECSNHLFACLSSSERSIWSVWTLSPLSRRSSPMKPSIQPFSSPHSTSRTSANHPPWKLSWTLDQAMTGQQSLPPVPR